MNVSLQAAPYDLITHSICSEHMLMLSWCHILAGDLRETNLETALG